MAEMLGHSQTKGRATGNPNLGLHHRATSRLYPCACGPDLKWIHAGPAELDAHAQTFAVRSDAGNIYVVALGSRWFRPLAEVFLDGEKVGAISAGKYRILTVPSGTHCVGVGWADVHDSVQIAVEDATNNFVLVTIAGGVWSESTETIALIGEQQGRTLVRDATLAGDLRGIVGAPASP